jgi:hypothetical protein
MQVASIILFIAALSIETWSVRSGELARPWAGSGINFRVVNYMDLQQRKPLPEGTWGGVGIQMDVSADLVSIAFDCADAEIPEKILLDKSGNFAAVGKFRRRHPGPVRPNEPPPVDATFAGRVSGNKMTLKISISTDSQSLGEFVLEQGRNGRIFRCL